MKRLIFVFILLIGFSSISTAQNLNGRFTSAVYSYERATSLYESETNLRNFNILSLNVNKDQFSLKTRMNFETDLSASYDNDPRLRLYNLYLEGRNLFNIATVKVGRQSIINSFGGLYDGVNLKFKYSDYSLTTYFGGNVPAYQKFELTDDLKEDYIMGAKFSTWFMDGLKLNLNYVRKNFKPLEYETMRLDQDFHPITYLVRKNSQQYQFVSADAHYYQKNEFNVDAKIDYDLNFKVLSKFQIGGKIYATDKLGVNLFYNYREPRIAYNSIFSVFNYGNSQEIEAGVDYKINKLFTAVCKFANVEYEDDNSARLYAGLNSKYGNISYRKTFGVAGELDAVSIYTAKTLLDGMLTPSVGISYTSYKLSEDEEDSNNLVSLLAGVNIRPWKKFSFDLQGQYTDNEIYKNDFRFLLKINHWFNTNF
ncbi:MAG: hypothetical protein JEY94_08315 [Melioribacteraceae bacterium]|nr:hypothetical protein [Melioribacteraceae bacterium]